MTIPTESVQHKGDQRRSRAAIQARVRKKRRQKAAHIRAAKEKPCADCGHRYPYYVMQFDHVRGSKEFDLCTAASKNASYARIDAEIAKCDVVCANCHAERSHSRH